MFCRAADACKGCKWRALGWPYLPEEQGGRAKFLAVLLLLRLLKPETGDSLRVSIAKVHLHLHNPSVCTLCEHQPYTLLVTYTHAWHRFQ